MDRLRGRTVQWAIIALMVCGITGCANTRDQGAGLVASSLPLDLAVQDSLPNAPSGVDPFSSADQGGDIEIPSMSRLDVAASDEQRQAPPQKPILRKESVDETEEPYDPFQTEGDRSAGAEEYDPWESYNSAMFEFNRKVDKYLLKPVATVYDKIVPDPVERGIRNFFHNVRFMPRLMNNLFQGKVKGAGLEMGRFLVNSTLGIAGFLDFAKNVFGMETPDEDLGQTLGVYGVKPGPYLILPFLPPFTLRDAVGYTGDLFLDPINYLVFPSIEIDGAPSLIDHNDRWTTTIAQFGTRVGEIVNERALSLQSFQGVEEATVDLYGAVRNAYLQRRAKQIRE